MSQIDFNDKPIQAKHDAILAAEQTPEFKAQETESLRAQRAHFWRVTAPYLAVLLLFGVGITAGSNTDWTPWIALAVVGPVLVAAAVLFPRRRSSWFIRK